MDVRHVSATMKYPELDVVVDITVINVGRIIRIIRSRRLNHLSERVRFSKLIRLPLIGALWIRQSRWRFTFKLCRSTERRRWWQRRFPRGSRWRWRWRRQRG